MYLPVSCEKIDQFAFSIKSSLDGTMSFNEYKNIENISRNFEDKKMLRSKVVNKMSCEPLPQKIIGK